MEEVVRDVRGDIMKAAREGFALKGYYGASMGDIVEKTGLSKGAIYWYFPGKWEMYKAVITEETKKMIAVVLPDEMRAPDEEASEFFVTRGERLIDMLADDPLSRLLFVQLMLDAMRGRDEMAEFATSLRDTIMEDAVSVVDMFIAGESRLAQTLPQRELVSMFVSILNGLILNLELNVSREEAKRSWRFLVKRVIGGEA